MRPSRNHPVHIWAVVNFRTRGSGGKLLIETGVACAIIRDSAGCVEFDRLERPQERPAQAKPVLYRVIEVFRRDITFTDQPKCLREQRALKPVQDEAIDLAIDRDRHLADLAIARPRAVQRLRWSPR